VVNKHAIISASLVVLATTGACKWSDFDALEEEVWVHSFEKPDNASTNWGVAIQRGRAAGTGGKLAVLGASQPLYGELTVSSNGDVAVANEHELGSEHGLPGIEVEPILLADPASDDIAFVTSTGAGNITVLRGPGTDGALIPHQVAGPTRPEAATYMVAPELDNGAGVQPSQTLVAEGDRVFGTFFGGVPTAQPQCRLTAGATPVNVRALGAVRQAGKLYDDVIVWTQTGNLFVWDGGVFNGARSSACPDATPADPDNTGTSAAPLLGPVETGFSPGAGAQILTFETVEAGVVTGRYAVLQGHNDAREGFLALVDLATLAIVGTPRTDRELRTAALMTLDGTPHVVAGYPNAVVDGTIAGQVLVLEISPQGATPGLGATPRLTLHDADPESNQAFGRGVAVMPFDGKPVIAVAADNEIFVYFRTNLYADTRSGR
jgi:hypothetical protein